MNGRWAYSPFRRRPIGPFHPANKGALICVTRAGQIRLIYQNPDSKWAELPAELKNTGYSDRLLTHAALVATQGATYSSRDLSCGMLTTQHSWNLDCHLLGVPEDLSLPGTHHLESTAMGSKPGQKRKSVPYSYLPLPPLQNRYAQQYLQCQPWR